MISWGRESRDLLLFFTHRYDIRECPVNWTTGGRSDSAKCHLPIEYAADLTPIVGGKEAGASWNARGMENALDF
jgi:hypothetical protein